MHCVCGDGICTAEICWRTCTESEPQVNVKCNGIVTSCCVRDALLVCACQFYIPAHHQLLNRVLSVLIRRTCYVICYIDCVCAFCTCVMAWCIAVIIIRRHRSVVCPSVHLYVCRLSHSCTLLKPLDRVRCHMAGTLVWCQETWEGEIWGSEPPVCSNAACCQITLAFLSIYSFVFYWSVAISLMYICFVSWNCRGWQPKPRIVTFTVDLPLTNEVLEVL